MKMQALFARSSRKLSAFGLWNIGDVSVVQKPLYMFKFLLEAIQSITINALLDNQRNSASPSEATRQPAS